VSRAARWAAAAAIAYLVAGRVIAPVLVARALRTDTLADLGGDDD
jgi:hypothetical protein